MSEESTQRTIARHLGLALQPLREAVASAASFRNFCWRLGFDVGTIPGSYAALTGGLDQVIQAVEADDLQQLIAGLRAVVSALGAGLAAPDGTPGSENGRKLLDLLLIEYLELNLPTIFQLLRSMGVIQAATRPATPVHPGFVEKRLNYDAIPAFVSDPLGQVRQALVWGAGQFGFPLLAETLMEAANSRGFSGRLLRPEDALGEYLDEQADFGMDLALEVSFFEGIVADQFVSLGVTLVELPGDNPGFVLQPLIPAKLDFAVSEDLHIRAQSNAANVFGVLFRPQQALSLRFPFSSVQETPSLSAAVAFTPAEPKILLGTASASRVEIKGATLGISVGPHEPTLEVAAELRTFGTKIVVQASEGDGFLGRVLGDQAIEIPFDLAVRWSSASGLAFGGSAKFELTLTPDLSIGPVHISRLTVGLSGRSADAAAQRSSALVASVGAELGAELGPVSCSVNGVGVNFDLTFADGNLGPFDLSAGFKAPSGVGIAINSGPVSGGGFLSFADGRYSGAVELTIYSVSVKAFGLIETKFPDGGRGFSFVIVISAEFPAIQLGFGFTLLGVGGLIGINRSVNANELQRLVTQGSAGNLLFPENVIGNAPAIIRDLGAVFPAREGHYVFGPLAKLGWGTPTLVRGELGLILELPGPTLSILGEVRVLLPKPEAPLVKLNLSVGGFIDFPHKTFALFAALHDSAIVGYPVSGQMAMRLAWGEQPSFVLSVGGFHPAFKPPADFPKLQPMALNLGKQGDVSVTVSGFFAVTSNTLQIGGEVTLHAGGSGISLDALLAAKALFVFSPFSFEARVDASVKISFHGRGPSVHLSGVLSGPSPWRMRGEVCVSILWWDACLRFDQTFSDGTPELLPTIDPWEGQPAADGTPAVLGLRAALEEPGNWKTELPPGSLSVVSLAAGSETLVDALGGLSVRERVVPLETATPITRFGAARTPAPITFALASAKLADGTELVHFADVQDLFASAQYFELDDAKKLSAPGFEKYQAGYRLQTNTHDVTLGSSRSLEPVAYDSLIIAADGSTSDTGQYLPSEAHLDGAAKKSAAALHGAHRGGTGKYVDRLQTQPIELRSALFSLAGVRSLQPPPTAPAPAQRSQALLVLAAHVAQKPEQRGLLQVVALHELA